MTIDKSKFTADELAQYEKLIAKATVSDKEKKPLEADAEKSENSQPSGRAANPKSQKSEPSGEGTQKSATVDFLTLCAPMQARIEQLEKSLEMKELLQVAEKYEIIGEKPEELAKNLYELKKSGETNYNAYLATLDKALSLAEKSGLFTEIGKASHGGETGGGAVEKIQAIATELQKSDPALSQVTAIQKAWESHPELVRKYDNECFNHS